MSTPQRLTQVAQENWNANRSVDPKVLRDLGYDTPETLPATIERVLGEETIKREAGLELVAEDHVPSPDAPKAAKLRDRPPARTARQKAARDQAQALDHKTPPEWTPHLTVIQGQGKK